MDNIKAKYRTPIGDFVITEDNTIIEGLEPLVEAKNLEHAKKLANLAYKDSLDAQIDELRDELEGLQNAKRDINEYQMKPKT